MLKPIRKKHNKIEKCIVQILCKLNCRAPHLCNKFIVPNNHLLLQILIKLESVTIHKFKMHFKKYIFASTNILDDF